jgi:hypothetical protein
MRAEIPDEKPWKPLKNYLTRRDDSFVKSGIVGF